MQKYTRDIVAQVLAATDIVDVLRPSLELQPAGPGRMKALCPFHHEKTPSFMVNRNRQTFHCFGCGKGGDAITFLMEHDGLTFVEALRTLADRAGIRLPATSKEDDQADYLRRGLQDFGRFAARYYVKTLQDPDIGAAGRAYLASRQLNPEIIKRFGLGYVPDGWSNLYDAARREGFKNDILEASGLFKKGRHGFYDFFRNRLMIPIIDVQEHVVAFGGRDLSGESPAKYINSPETVLYKKSGVLYGLNHARKTMLAEKRALLVEGYFDLLRCFDAGIENVVATCGTALTQAQARLLRRYVPEVVIVYDGDVAGVNAALKATGLLTGAGLTVRALALPDGQDPDDYIQAEGAPAFAGLLANAPDFVQFYAEMTADRRGTAEAAAGVAHELFGILEQVDDELRIDQYLRQMAERLGLSEWACRKEFEKHRRGGGGRPARTDAPQEAAPARVNADMCAFVAALLAHDGLLAEVNQRLAHTPLEAGPLASVLEMLAAGGECQAARLEDDAARALYTAAAALEAPEPEAAGNLVRHWLDGLERESKRAESKRLHQEIVEAEHAQDSERVAKLLARKLKLDQESKQWGAA